MSAGSRPAALPRATTLERPTPASSTIPAMPKPKPDCETSEKPPAAKRSELKAEEKPAKTRPGTFISPWQFGPSSPMPCRSARAATSRCAASPAAPVSAKPEPQTMANGTPAAPQASIAAGTRAAATMTMARSGTSGSAATRGSSVSPSTSVSAGSPG